MKAPVSEKGKGKDLSLALANRSAALLRLKKPRLALQDIELAMEAGYPVEMRYKLMERKVKIAAQLGDRAGYHEALVELREALADASGLEESKKEQMFQGAEELVGGITEGTTVKEEQDTAEISVEIKELCDYMPAWAGLANQVDIEWAPHRGRFAVANKKIPEGTLLVVDTPQTTVLQEAEKRCDCCLKNMELVVVPCPGCCHVAYCSLDCRKKAWGVHQFECGMQGLLRALSGDKNNRDMGRLCFRALCKKPAAWYPENKESLAQRIPMFGDSTWKKCPHHALLTLDKHEDAMDPGRLWSFLLTTCCHLRTLQLGGYFGGGRAGQRPTPKLEAEELEVGEWAVKLLMLALYNMQTLTKDGPNDR